MSDDLAGYARSGAWSLVAHGAQLLGAIVLSILVVRSLDTEQIGILSLARQLTALAVLLGGLALERVLLRFVPELVQAAGPQAAVRFFWRTLALRTLGWIPWMVVVLLAGAWLDRVFHTEIATAARIGVATGVLFSFHNHVRAAATARFATAAVARGSTVGSAATLAFTLWLLNAGYGVDGVLLGAGVGIFLGALFMLPGVLRRTKDDALEESVGGGHDLSLLSRRFLSYALPFGGIALLNFAVHSQTEVFFLGYYHGAEKAGFFHYGFTFAQRLIDFLPLALWEVSMAGFSRIAVREPERLPGALKAYLTLLYLAMAPLALLGIAFSTPAIVLLYTEKMMPSVIVSQAYFVMAAIAAFGAPVGMLLYAREKVGAALRAYLIFAAVNLALDLALIPSMGLWGAILGLGAAKVVAVILMSRLAWREIPGLTVPWRFIGRVFLASAPALLWLLVDDRWIAPWQVLLGGLAAILVLVGTFRLLRVVGPSEAALIRGTRLPLREPVLRLLGHGPVGATAEVLS